MHLLGRILGEPGVEVGRGVEMGHTRGSRRSCSRPLLQIEDQPTNSLAHLLESYSADGRDPGRGLAGAGGDDAGGLVDEALRPDPLLHGLDELLGLVAGDPEELPPLLEGLEGGFRGCRLLAAGEFAGLEGVGCRRDEFEVGVVQRLDDALHEDR